jgi:hypothetical protein
MHIYKKFTFLNGTQHWFCMNYYVDEAELEIKEKNIFTAMEIITLIPMQGSNSFTNFFRENDWTKIFFPVYHSSSLATKNIPEILPGRLQKLTEKLFSGRIGDKLDGWLMNITDKRWKKKAAKHRLNNKGGNMGMVVDRHFSKPNPKNFQEKVVQQYEAKVKQILQQQYKTAAFII